MSYELLLIGLAGVIASATPIVVATIGETITERAGLINLSLNGTIILSAMAGFAIAATTNNLYLGFLLGGIIGALVALIVAFSSITIRQSQVAVGFVLTFLCRDLAYFMGNPYMGMSGPKVPPPFTIPLLSKIPFLGPLLFNQNILTYLYTVLGGFLVGLAGPMYSLSVKAGWKGTISGLDGIGWIVLAIVIFGGWKPVRTILGAYLFAFLQWLSLVMQSSMPDIPSQVLQVAPFPLMIFALLLVNVGRAEWVERELAAMPEKPRIVLSKILRALRTSPPASLGVPFENE